MVKALTPISVCGSSQNPSLSWAYSIRKLVPASLAPHWVSMAAVTRDS